MRKKELNRTQFVEEEEILLLIHSPERSLSLIFLEFFVFILFSAKLPIHSSYCLYNLWLLFSGSAIHSIYFLKEAEGIA
jgi:hypothetical protein